MSNRPNFPKHGKRSVPRIGQKTINVDKLPVFKCTAEVVKSKLAKIRDSSEEYLEGSEGPCDSIYFTKVNQIRPISRLVSPEDQEGIVFLDFWQCVKCGAVYGNNEIHGRKE